MTTSNVKRLRNEMILLEEESDRYVPWSKYYILNIKIREAACPPDIQEWTTSFLSRNTSHQPIVTYTYGNIISLVYSCLEEGFDHYLKGSHHRIISEYVSLLSGEILSAGVECSIVEFETRTQILTYFSWKVHSNSKNCLMNSSSGTITAADINTKTSSELMSMLKESGADWDAISDTEKYGIFYKLKKRRGKVIVSSISEAFDARDTRKYTTFIFG